MHCTEMLNATAFATLKAGLFIQILFYTIFTPFIQDWTATPKINCAHYEEIAHVLSPRSKNVKVRAAAGCYGKKKGIW